MKTDSVWIAFDCETTGFPPSGCLIEIGAVAFHETGEVISEFQRLVRPPVSIPEFVVELTGISTSMVRDCPSAKSVLEEFFQWLPKGGILVAHNTSFDAAVILREDHGLLQAANSLAVDSLILARTLGEFPNNRLETIARTLGVRRQSHRALQDARVVRRLFMHALQSGLRTRHAELFQGRPLREFAADYFHR